MKLFDCVELVQNNYDCVILKVKEGKEFDLICLGCFNGNEKMFRLTKGGDHTCTVWTNDGKNYSWHWGDSGHTLVCDSMRKMGHLIQDCIEQELDIYIGTDKARRSEQVKNEHEIKCIHRGGYSGNICVHKDGEYYRDFEDVVAVKNHFKELGFTDWEATDYYTAVTGVKVECFVVKKAS